MVEQDGGSPFAKAIGWVSRRREEAQALVRGREPVSSAPQESRYAAPISTSDLLIEPSLEPLATAAPNASIDAVDVPKGKPATTLEPLAKETSNTGNPKGTETSAITASSKKTRVSQDPEGSHSSALASAKHRTETVLTNLSVERHEALRTPSPIAKPMSQDPEESVSSGRSREPPPILSVPLPNRSSPDLQSISTTTQVNDDRPSGAVCPECEPVTISVGDTQCTFKPIVEGFDHPHRRGWIGREPPPILSVLLPNRSSPDLQSISTATQVNDDRPNGAVCPECEPVTINVGDTQCTFKPIVEGFDHPHRRGWIGPDQSRSASICECCAVKKGFDPGIFNSCAGAWVRTADHSAVSGTPPIMKGFRTCAEAVQFMGCDPDAGEANPSPDIHRPPKRTSVLPTECMPDPHLWCPSSKPKLSAFMPPVDPNFSDNDVSNGASSDSSATAIQSNAPSKESSRSVTAGSESVEIKAPALSEGKMMQSLVSTLLAAIDSKLPTAEDKAEAQLAAQLTKETAKDMPDLVAGPTSDQVSLWKMSMHAQLNTPLWFVDDTHILALSDDGDLTEQFQVRNRLLARLLVKKLGQNHPDVIQNNMHHAEAGRGVSLFHAFIEHLDPNNETAALLDFRLFVDGVQLNGESVATLTRALREKHRRLSEAGFNLGDRALLLQLVRAVLDGACGNAPEFRMFSTDIAHKKLISSDETFDSFASKVKSVMTAAGLIENGVAERLPAGALSRRTSGGVLAAQPNLDHIEDPMIGQMKLTGLDIDSVFKRTKCPICRIPRGHRGDHHVSECPESLRRGVRGMHYDKDYDEARKERERGSQDKKTDPKKAQTNGEAESAGSAKRVAAGAKRVATANAFDALSQESEDEPETEFIDTHVDSSNIKNYDSESHMHSAYDKLISSSSHAHLKCIGACRIVTNDRRHHESPLGTLCADSGATSDMFALREHFKDDCKTCKNVCVAMGDGSPVPAAGMGTVRFKMHGHIIELPNALHVPKLDCNLLSITRHGLRGKGCTHLVASGNAHSTFPEFSMSMPIESDGDPRFNLETTDPSEEGICDYSGGIIFNPFSSVSRRMAFVRRMHEARVMTRAQKKKELENRKDLVKQITAIHLASPAKKPVEPRSTTERDLDELKLRRDGNQNDPDIHVPPQFSVESARGSTKDRYSRYELERLFGGRELRDCSILSKLGTGMTVTDNVNDIPTAGKLVNRRRGRRSRKRAKTLHPRSLIGMDVGYGPSASPGGYKCCLVPVDHCTTNSWTFGMKGTSGADIQEASWRFFIEAGGFPKKIQCDFDPRFIGGQAKALLQSHGCSVTAAPPDRQSQNGMAERRWKIISNMARAHLADAKLPTKFWHWAAREATTRLNMLPVSSNADNPTDPASMTTPHEAFHGQQPDCRVLFPFGCLGSFRRHRDGNHKRNTFASQGMPGIASGRSEHTNGMIFYNPTLDSFSTSRTTSLIVPGALVGETVFILDDTKNVQAGTITMPPTTVTKTHTIKLESGLTASADADHIHTEFAAPAAGVPSDSLGFFTPTWLKQGTKITYLVDDVYQQGFLNLDDDFFWEFVTRDAQGKTATRLPLPDLNCSWKDRIQQNVMQLGWQNDAARKIQGIGRHVSAANLVSTMAPANPPRAFAAGNPDSPVWRAAHDEECDGLDGLDAFVEIDESECKSLVDKHGDAALAIPTVNIFTVKKDNEGKPVRAESRIVVLGNLEKRVWEKIDRHAPVINSASCRLLVTVAVESGRVLKQGDCKNAFCQPELPSNEIAAVKPPKGCPRSKPGVHWKLKKTLCGLSGSPGHWCDAFRKHPEDLGFKPVGHDPCVFKCAPFPDKAPICLGMHADDFVHFSTSDQVEEWFEQELAAKLKADFVGPVSWFLGCNCDWHKPPDGRLACHISQQAFTEQLLEKFGMQECIPSNRICKQGLVIDRIDRENKPKQDCAKFAKSHQSLMGGLTWLVTGTRPDVNVATKPLSQFNSCPSAGHFSSAKQVLRYLKATASHGIWYTQGERRLHGNVSFPEAVNPNGLIAMTDSDWGPQDASKPKAGETRTVGVDELNSVQGHCITRMGGPLTWGVHREERISRSSCEAEIKAMDPGAVSVQFIKHLVTELGIEDKRDSAPVLLNDNRGSVDWTKNGCILTKRLRHAGVHEGAVAEAQKHGEISICWIPGKENPADLFTKEITDVGHFEKLRDLMARPREWVHNGCEENDPIEEPCSTAAMKRRKKTMNVVSTLPASGKRVRFADQPAPGHENGSTDVMHFGRDIRVELTNRNTSLASLRDPDFWNDRNTEVVPGGCQE